MSYGDYIDREAEQQSYDDEHERLLRYMPRVFGNPAAEDMPWLQPTESEESDD